MTSPNITCEHREHENSESIQVYIDHKFIGQAVCEYGSGRRYLATFGLAHYSRGFSESHPILAHTFNKQKVMKEISGSSSCRRPTIASRRRADNRYRSRTTFFLLLPSKTSTRTIATGTTFSTSGRSSETSRSKSNSNSGPLQGGRNEQSGNQSRRCLRRVPPISVQRWQLAGGHRNGWENVFLPSPAGASLSGNG